MSAVGKTRGTAPSAKQTEEKPDEFDKSIRVGGAPEFESGDFDPENSESQSGTTSSDANDVAA